MSFEPFGIGMTTPVSIYSFKSDIDVEQKITENRRGNIFNAVGNIKINAGDKIGLTGNIIADKLELNSKTLEIFQESSSKSYQSYSITDGRFSDMQFSKDINYTDSVINVSETVINTEQVIEHKEEDIKIHERY